MQAQNVANFCVKCEEKFTKWADYHTHVALNTCYKHIKPVKLSNRTKVQIVSDFESTTLKGAIIQ